MEKNNILTIFLVIIISIIITSINVRPKINEDINLLEEKVIRYLENDIIFEPKEFNTFYLLFDEYLINTKTVHDLLSFFDNNNYEFKIIAIYPYINPLYQDILEDIYSILIYDDELLNIINSFYNIYTKELEIHNLDKEITKNFIHGIRIRKISIYTSNEAMHHFLSTYNDIKYSLSTYGLFKKIVN